MHKAICTKVQGQTHVRHVLNHIWSNFLNFSLFMWFWIFTYTKLKHKSKIKHKTMHTNKCKMHKMHENMTFNARRVQQRLKKLDQGPKKQQQAIFTQNRFTLFSTTSTKLKFFFSFDSYKSMKFRALRS